MTTTKTTVHVAMAVELLEPAIGEVTWIAREPETGTARFGLTREEAISRLVAALAMDRWWEQTPEEAAARRLRR